MLVGVPNEIKSDEYRVAMIPVGVEELTRAGHKVVIQAGAGLGSGIPDEQYAIHGADIVPTAEEAWTRAVISSGITAIAYETIKDTKGNLPLLTPMSEVAGRMSIQEGAKFLERPM